jgi:cysteine-rich repeat protein
MWLLIAAAFVLLATPSTGFAHGVPIPIAIWSNNFTPAESHCQRIIARSAATCGLEVWKLSDACQRAQLNGESCDIEATEFAIEQAHTVARETANDACRSGVDLGAMGFASIVDMNIDVDVFCQELQQAMDSAIYGPLQRAGGAVDPVTRDCIEAASDAATRLLEAGFRARRRALDHIAHARYTPSRKFALIGDSTGRIQRARERQRMRLGAACPTFATIYPIAVAPFMNLIGERADCLSGRVYVQDFVVCPDSFCGNGMREPAERCDDGNTVSGDGCRNDCQAATP